MLRHHPAGAKRIGPRKRCRGDAADIEPGDIGCAALACGAVIMESELGSVGCGVFDKNLGWGSAACRQKMTVQVRCIENLFDRRGRPKAADVDPAVFRCGILFFQECDFDGVMVRR